MEKSVARKMGNLNRYGDKIDIPIELVIPGTSQNAESLI
jgi:hypothetical protein